MASAPRLWDFRKRSNRIHPMWLETRFLTMDPDLHDTIDFLNAAARSLGAEVTSPWVYLQLGLILAGAGLALAAGAGIRSQFDAASFAKGWPAPLRMIARVLITHSSTV